MTPAASQPLSELPFAAWVQAIAADPARHDELTALLREEHPVYRDRGSSALVRMRGWVLLALARVGVSEAALNFVLEELQTGTEPYLVAAAARALRSSAAPRAAFAPFVLQAITNIRYREEPLSFGEYGEIDDGRDETSPLRELLATLAWLGPHAFGFREDIEALRTGSRALPAFWRGDVERIVTSLRTDAPIDGDDCCPLAARVWPWSARPSTEAIQHTLFEDHAGHRVTFGEFFRGRPTIVVFFYTRCDNPQKCSLTVTKLARIQNLLVEHGLDGHINTAGITYDPEYDDAERLRAYALNRGARLDDDHRMLRTTADLDSLRAYFQLGVNYIRSLVNRHRLEVYVLDRQGRIAARFERLHWSEEQVVARAKACLEERPPVDHGSRTSALFGSAASLGLAFFPRCPACWAAYLSAFGIAGLEKIPYTPWLIPVFGLLLLINLAGAGFRAWATGRTWPVLLVLAGVGLLGLKLGLGWDEAALPGVLLTLTGSVGNAWPARRVSHPS